MMQHVNAAVPDPRDLNPQLPRPLCELIVRMLDKEPDERFPNYEALVNAMAQIRELVASRLDEELNFSNRRTDVVGVNFVGVTAAGAPNTVYADAKNFWGHYDDQETPWVERATFAKLREMKLSFELTPNVLEKLPFSTGRVTLVGRNLAIICGARFCDNVDPESDGVAYADNHARGIEYLSGPGDRTLGINFSVTR